ncbi:hypothetical protein AL073_17060 [Loktanella sp. 1ANDIMAR09]|nr:hypothetical protein AL073_17060 [Loktanella sp. 1ANDIMAR09]
MQVFIEWFSALGALLGGLAAAASVLFANRSTSKREEEKLLEELRAVAVQARDSAGKIDRSLNWPLFLDIEERFRKKISPIFESVDDFEKLKDVLDQETLGSRFPRAVQLAIQESSVRKDLELEFLKLRQASVNLRQSFPISGWVLEMCTTLMENASEMYFSETRLHKQVMEQSEGKYLDNFESLRPEDYAYHISTLVADAPMSHIVDEAQPVINDTRKILGIITDTLSKKKYNELLKQANYEQKSASNFVNQTSTVTGDIKAALDGIRDHFDKASWDELVSAHARLEAQKLLSSN